MFCLRKQNDPVLAALLGLRVVSLAEPPPSVPRPEGGCAVKGALVYGHEYVQINIPRAPGWAGSSWYSTSASLQNSCGLTALLGRIGTENTSCQAAAFPGSAEHTQTGGCVGRALCGGEGKPAESPHFCVIQQKLPPISPSEGYRVPREAGAGAGAGHLHCCLRRGLACDGAGTAWRCLGRRIGFKPHPDPERLDRGTGFW